MKQFDWEYHKKTRDAKYHDFLKEVHDTAMTEDAFVKEWKKLKGTDHTPSKGRKEYRALKEKFGFFT